MSTYLISQRVKESSGKVSGFMLGTLNLRFQKEFLAPPWRPPPQVQACSSRTGPSGDQVKCHLDAIAMLKCKGITSDHVVFSFMSHRIQSVQRRKHPAFRYEGTKDPTRLSPEAMSHSEVVRRCCKLLDDFDKSLVLPALFLAVNPPENTWVRFRKPCRVLVGKPLNNLMNPLFVVEL